MADYDLVLSDSAGSPLVSIKDFISLSYSNILNTAGAFSLLLPGGVYDQYLQADNRLSIYRSVGQRVYLDKQFLITKLTRLNNSKGENIKTIQGQGLLSLLDRRIVAYASETAQAKKNQALDDMMKAVMRENFGSLATDTSRDISNQLTIAANNSLGPIVTASFAWRKVSEVFADLYAMSIEAGKPVFYDIYPDGDTLTFQTWVERRGVDRTQITGDAPLTLSLQNGLLLDSASQEDHSNEETFIYAGGQGQGAARTILTAQDDNRIGLSPFGRREGFVAQTNSADTAALQAAADAALILGRPFYTFEGTVADNPQARYGLDWAVGDWVTASDGELTVDCAVDSVAITIKDGKEDISANLRVATYL